MATVSGLSPYHASIARKRFQQAAVLGYHARNSIHYTQGPTRWQGIDQRRVAIRGHYPNYADCSAFATWVLWNALYVTYGHRDTVNGTGWRAGYTGTLLGHGVRVHELAPGDLVIYGSGYPGSHVACYTGGGLVVSMGSEAGPLLVPVRYRGDVLSLRRYI